MDRLIARTSAAAVSLTLGLLSACSASGASSASDTAGPSATPSHGSHQPDESTISLEDRATAQLATAASQDVEAAEAAGYVSTLDTLGCFEDAALGGMGVHYLNETLMDRTVDIAAPEALVYELDRRGHATGLVAHEYIVPVDAWTAAEPPTLFGLSFHRHPSLPLWVLHAWLWKDNPTGMFADWNPAVRLCPDGVPIFGVDLPVANDSPSSTEQ